jgi:hypothetical protein
MHSREGLCQRRLLYAAAFLRALSIGLMAVLIALYCARLGLSAAQIGVVLSALLWREFRRVKPPEEKTVPGTVLEE